MFSFLDTRRMLRGNLMFPPEMPEDRITQSLRRILPILSPIFDLFGVPVSKRQEVVAVARAELVAKHPDLYHPEAWLLRRILRQCTEDEAEIFWGEGEIPEELLFRKLPTFGKPDKDR